MGLENTSALNNPNEHNDHCEYQEKVYKPSHGIARNETECPHDNQ